MLCTASDDKTVKVFVKWMKIVTWAYLHDTLNKISIIIIRVSLPLQNTCEDESIFITKFSKINPWYVFVQLLFHYSRFTELHAFSYCSDSYNGFKLNVWNF